jgi:glycosyltransferase involved in cell wall biosynthesis
LNQVLDSHSATPAFQAPIRRDARAVLLINAIVRHQQPQFAEATKLMPNLKCLVSVDKEPQRDYSPDFSSLDVAVQKNWTRKKKWKHGAGFEDDLFVHFPYDTYSQLRRLKPDVVLSHELGFRTLVSCLYRKTHRRSRLAIAVNESEHTVAAWGGYRKALRRYLLKSADVVTFNGDSCYRYLTEQMRVPKSKLKLLTYVAHPDMIYGGPTSRSIEQRHRLLYVGQLTERKNILPFLQTLIRWAHDHPNKMIDFSIAGRGNLSDQLRSLPCPNNLKLSFLGSVDPSRLPSIYGEHGMMVFPTLADEWGLVTNESMHSGLPILASVYAQSTLVVVKDNEHGWHFKSDDMASTYDGITRALNTSADQLDRMAASARAAIADRTPAWGGMLVADAMIAALNS